MAVVEEAAVVLHHGGVGEAEGGVHRRWRLMKDCSSPGARRSRRRL